MFILFVSKLIKIDHVIIISTDDHPDCVIIFMIFVAITRFVTVSLNAEQL